MWDGVTRDEIRYLRISIRNDEQHLANAPLGPIQKSRLKKQIERQKSQLKELNRAKRERKKAEQKNEEMG